MSYEILAMFPSTNIISENKHFASCIWLCIERLYQGVLHCIPYTHTFHRAQSHTTSHSLYTCHSLPFILSNQGDHFLRYEPISY